MPRDGSATRTALMDAAETLILDRGFAGTTVEDVIGIAGVTKGAFFHHFPSKQVLARDLMRRWVRLDLEHLDRALAEAEGRSDDPRDQLLAFVAHYESLFAQLEEPYAGCLMASYVSESDLIDDDVLAMIEHAMRTWRDRIGAKLQEVADAHPPVREVDLVDLADTFTVVAEGAFVVSRTLREARVTGAQFRLLGQLLNALFDG